MKSTFSRDFLLQNRLACYSTRHRGNGIVLSLGEVKSTSNPRPNFYLDSDANGNSKIRDNIHISEGSSIRINVVFPDRFNVAVFSAEDLPVETTAVSTAAFTPVAIPLSNDELWR
jgi:hypothetical protein